jgi:hypothetical protein
MHGSNTFDALAVEKEADMPFGISDDKSQISNI